MQEWRFEKHRERASIHLAAGDVDVALLELFSALRIHPDDPGLNFEIAEIESSRLNPSAARFFYEEAHRSDPGNVEGAIKLALLLLGDDPIRGRELVERASLQEPDNPWAAIGFSEVALASGDTFWAREVALEAIRLDPDSPRARWQLVRVQVATIRERTQQDLPIPESLIEDARNSIADYALVAPSDRGRAVIELARVFSASPRHQAAAAKWFGLAMAAAQEFKRPQLEAYCAAEALRFAHKVDHRLLQLGALRRLTRLEPDELKHWRELAEISGELREQIFEELIAARPEDPAAWLLVVREQLDQKDPGWVDGFLNQGIDTGVNAPVLLGALADLQLAAGRGDDWAATSRRLLSEHPQHPRTTIARAHLALSRPEAGVTREEAALMAAEPLRRLVEFDQSTLALRLLAISESRLGNHARALAAIERAGSLSGSNLQIERLHAKILHDAGFWKFALTLLLRLSNQTALSDSERLMLARSAYRSDKPRLARRTVMELLAEENPPAGAAVELADHEPPDRRLYPKIIRALDAELEGGTSDPRVLALATAMDLERGHREVAIDRLRSQIDSQIGGGLRSRERVNGLKGREKDLAIARTRQARRRIDAIARYATTLQLERAESEALVAMFRAARSGGMLGPRGHMWLGRLQLNLGRAREARASFERALAGGVEDAWMKNELALLLARNGIQLERAVQLARETVAAVGHADALDTLGYTYLRAGDPEAALEEFRRAVELSEGDPQAEFQYHRGLALVGVGETDRAAEAFDAALAIDPDLAEAATALAEIERNAGLPTPRGPS